MSETILKNKSDLFKILKPEEQHLAGALWISSQRNNERERQKQYAFSVPSSLSYKALLTNEKFRIKTELKITEAKAIKILKGALEKMNKDMGSIIYNEEGKFSPSKELIQEYVTEAILSRKKETREARELL